MIIEENQPVEDAELEELREKRKKENKIDSLLKKIVWHVMILWLIFAISYSNRDINANSYKKSLKALMIPSIYSKVTQNFYLI